MDTSALLDSNRLDALDATELLDSPTEATFDRLTQLAVLTLHVPIALVSLVDVNRQFFKSAQGLPEPWASYRETSLSHSFCHHVVASGEPLIVEDAREHPLVCDNPAVTEIGVVAYAGIPLVTNDGHVLGSFCAIDGQPRTWNVREIGILRELAASAVAEIELRRKLHLQERERAHFAAQATQDQLTGLANRRGFGILAQHTWDVARRKGWEMVVMYIDLDGFKAINDTFGHAEGDRVLGDVADLLRRIYRRTDIAARVADPEQGGLARLGGDEFVVLAMDVQPDSERLLVERLEAELERFNAESGRPYRVELSIGAFRVSPATFSSLDDALVEADRRMYLAKTSSGARR